MVLPRSRRFWAVSTSHLIIDMFNGAVPVIIAFLSGHILSMTNTQIGIAISAYQLSGALSQPLMGMIADRTGGRLIGAGGVAWVVIWQIIALGLAATTGSYWLFVIPLALAALGSAAYHPVGTMHAADSERQRANYNLSIFFFMGQSGGGLGPAMAGVLLDSFATHNAAFTAALGPAFRGVLVESGTVTPLLAMALLGIPGTLLMALALPGRRAYMEAHPPTDGRISRQQWGAIAYAPLLLLIVIIMLRGLVNPGVVSFLPRLLELRGWSAAEYGALSSAYWIGMGIVGVIFGRLADRMGARTLIVVSMLLSAPMVLGLTGATQGIAFVLAFFTGGFSGGSHTLIVSMTHKMLPMGKGFASGAALGLIFAMGAVGVLIIGALADAIGLETTFRLIAASTIVVAVLSLFLPDDRPKKLQPQPAIELEPAPERA